MRVCLTLLLFPLYLQVFSQQEEEQNIRDVLATQQECWNDGDLDCFMEGYWKSDKLTFIGKSGITYGWQETLNNYKKSYPDRAAMGKLTFEIIEMEQLSEDFWMVMGKWGLERESSNPAGYFTLLFRNFAGDWLIVSDHSS